ncbi:hypothetical protein [Thermococcus sp.]
MEEDKAYQASRKSWKIVNVIIGDEKTEKKWVWHPDLEKTGKDSRVLPPFDKLRKAAPTIALILETEYDHIPESKRKKMDRFVKAAIALTERLAEIKARGKKATKHIKAGNVPEFEEFVNALKAVAPSEMIVRKKTTKSSSSGHSASRKSARKSENGKVTAEARELLGMLKGLRYAAYSEGAVKRAVDELEAKVKVLLSNPGKNLELLGLYLTLERFIKEGDFQRTEKFLEGLAR